MIEDWLENIAYRATLYAARKQVVKLCRYYKSRSIPFGLYLITSELEELFNVTEDDLEINTSEQKVNDNE